MTPGLVTTIIPVFNRPGPLARAVESVLAQTYPHKEIIVVDDGSDDGLTAAAAHKLANDHASIRVVTQSNAGPGAARETGRGQAQGEFIQYLDSDDILLPGKFELQVAALHADDRAGIAYGVTLDRAGKPSHGTEVAHRSLYPAVTAGRIWPTLSPLYRRSVCDAIGPWAPMRILEDWDYECRAGVLGVQLHHCPQPVAQIMGDDSDHAGRAWLHDVRAMRDRVGAYARAVAYAQQAGVLKNAPQMQTLVRSTFWMAREAAAYGLADEARGLFALAKANAGGRRTDYLVFETAAHVLGWRAAGRAAKWLGR